MPPVGQLCGLASLQLTLIGGFSLKGDAKVEVTNEIGVIVKFSSECSRGNIKVIQISDAFPDALIEYHGQTYKVEFEYKASNFIQHKHDIRECDFIICWVNDLEETNYPIIDISVNDWWLQEPPVLHQETKEILYWKTRAKRAERSLRILKGNHQTAKVKPTLYVPRDLTIDQRQQVVNQMANDGLTNGDIAIALGVSEGTIKNDKRVVRSVNGKG